jgi:hypothetical protein
MTFLVIGSECAPGISSVGPTLEAGTAPSNAAAIDLTARFGLDRLSSHRRRLVCHWTRPTNRRLMNTPVEAAAAETRRMIRWWGVLHAGRSALGLVATLIFLWAQR